MRNLKLFSAIACLLMLSACTYPAVEPTAHQVAPEPDQNDPKVVATSIDIQRDNFKKITTYTGPRVAKLHWSDKIFIRAWKYDDGSASYQIYIEDNYFDDHWRRYDSAYDSNGNSMDTTLISRDVEQCSRNSCTYIEHIGLNITRDYLENNINSGIQFKVSGVAGEEIFTIPSGYIKAFLSVTK